MRCPYLVDVLALKLGQELVQALAVGLDTDGLEDLLDVGGAGRGVAAQGEEKVSCEVLHCGGLVATSPCQKKKKLPTDGVRRPGIPTGRGQGAAAGTYICGSEELENQSI